MLFYEDVETVSQLFLLLEKAIIRLERNPATLGQIHQLRDIRRHLSELDEKLRTMTDINARVLDNNTLCIVESHQGHWRCSCGKSDCEHALRVKLVLRGEILDKDVTIERYK